MRKKIRIYKDHDKLKYSVNKFITPNKICDGKSIDRIYFSTRVHRKGFSGKFVKGNKSLLDLRLCLWVGKINGIVADDNVCQGRRSNVGKLAFVNFFQTQFVPQQLA